MKVNLEVMFILAQAYRLGRERGGGSSACSALGMLKSPWGRLDSLLFDNAVYLTDTDRMDSRDVGLVRKIP
jgi:hypothetical protein